MTTIHDILAEFRSAASNNRDLGDKFERLIANYLVTEPQYQDQFSDVWMWSEWPGRGKQPDTGIDLVAQNRYTGELCAIQCKFYDPAHRLEKVDLDSFFATSGKHPFTSRMIVSTTDIWGKHAEELLNNQQVPCIRIRVQDLENSAVDWSHFSLSRPDRMKLKPKKELRPHQTTALRDVLAGLAEADRGKLIMACGTGKTFTALRIAETFAVSCDNANTGRILFLVPSIALIAQSLSEWTAESKTPMHCFAVCSDVAVGKTARDNEDIRLHDLPFPATTDARKLGAQLKALTGQRPLTVVFSTYQSIATIHEAQAKFGAPEFDLVICDEAHRTTGVTLAGNDESHFVKVHDAAYIKAAKRLYMTATPRIFADAAKSKASEADAVVCSMDDAAVYGNELHRLGFGEAVGAGLLADYKVMVLAVDEKFVSETFQKQLAKDGELNLDDAVRIVGCWNGLAKRMVADVGNPAASVENDPAPMHRAVAFSRSIKDSQRIADLFPGVVGQYIEKATDDEQDSLLRCEADHVDGTMNALKRSGKLDWLKADTSAQGNVCRILSNARCLSEGVDVPALDAVLFLNPRNSVVDVVQSVGRVMRVAPGKKYGYIILPVGVPAGVAPEVALQDNDKYKVIWQVLQALRAHDDRFNSTINKIELNQARPDNIQVIGVGGGGPSDGDDGGSDKGVRERTVQYRLDFPNLDEWRDAIFAKIVLKCGDRRYWESWAQDVSKIAERHVMRIKALLESADEKPRKAFEKFLTGLRNNLNPAVSADDAIEMLAQHLITQPVFDALFEGYAFTEKNPVSRSMKAMLKVMDSEGLSKEQEQLEKFYTSVRARAGGIDNAEGKQRIIIELYEKFFKLAFKKATDRLGIVYTPVEVVDFIIKSADHALREEFGVGLTGEGVHVLDPFTGTGTFIVRLLQSGLIAPHDLARKYAKELHANEIVLLAYYIAAVNIEAAWHGQMLATDKTAGYQPFEGIVLTDTFQLTEGKGTLEEEMFPDNNKRAKRQNAIDIRVIVGNPPYSVGQDSENDNNKNLKYPILDERIRSTYAARSEAGLLRNLYDSYIRAIRWASDRVKDKGIVCYVTNGRFIDAGFADGMRLTLADEFSRIYIFNMRGFVKGRVGDDAKREGGNVFNILTGVSIAVLVKNPEHTGTCELRYHDIGDYVTREEKLKILGASDGIASLPWLDITPNNEGDWINQRDPAFEKFIPVGDKDDDKTLALFITYSLGVTTNRDAWAYNFSYTNLAANMGRMIAFYNDQRALYEKVMKRNSGKPLAVEDVIDTDSTKISWTRSLKADVRKMKTHEFDEACIVTGLYRPFTKQRLYFNRSFNEMIYLMPKLFPQPGFENLVIAITGPGARRPFSALIADSVTNLDLQEKCQSFPLYHYEAVDPCKPGLFNQSTESGFMRHDAISDSGLKSFQSAYGIHRNADDKTCAGISKEDLFYYVYGILHSTEYKQRFESDLKKQLPRIPFARDFWAFSNAGRALAQWHLNYETVEPYPLQQGGELDLGDAALYRVRKMAFARSRVDGKLTDDKTTIIYNSRIRLSGIPLEAYDYIVNGKPAIEWVMERYQVVTETDSGNSNDPNDWAIEHNDPQYILNLVKRVVRVSVETVKIVNALPALTEITC
jgi:predicted helicase